MGVLYHVSKNIISRKKSFQYVVPAALREKVLQGVHDEAGHQGQQRTLSLARQRFYWHGLDKDVKEYVQCCRRCVFSKSPEPARAPLESIITTRPLELVCIDFWSAEDSSNKSVDVLVVTDHFTKLAQAYPCSNQLAKVVAWQLWNNFFCTYGFPDRVHSDQGANFESSLIAEMLQVVGIQKSHTTPYHPMGNGCVERFNRTLGNMIRALLPKAKHRWPQMLKALTFSYNSTVHETPGYAPFNLMFGRCPRLPVDLMFESVLQDEQVADYDAYVQALRRDLAEAVKIAQASAGKQQKRQANLYDRKLRGAPVDVGDRVLLANKGERGKRKLADRWEGHLYDVTEKNKGVHTFKIRNSETGVEKVVHRYLIMPLNFLPVQDGSEVVSCETDITEDVEVPSEDNAEVDSVAATDRDSNDRTVTWVSELPNPGDDQSDASEDVHSMDGMMTDRETDKDASSSVAVDTVCTTDPAGGADKEESLKRRLREYGLSTPFSTDPEGHFLSHLLSANHKRRVKRGADQNVEQLFYNITALGREFHLWLRPNHRLVAPGATVEWRDNVGELRNGTSVENGKQSIVSTERILRKEPLKTDCTFVGGITDLPGASVAINNCDGLAPCPLTQPHPAGCLGG
ncbi:hypothetical protein AAFF_G00338120 [Aldrovandia affinis]|uniref:Gypsy retrotransposon integrase-like protein 1 n=1 Tax=Aldrovandia affinis TaxID=143900 RepID=A0AAD7SLC7_9TELE|nr:hypothetical protein AAFF_G00338120 [Aldrovandia affinis]